MPKSQPELNPWHKRQAALLYHFASAGYLKGLLPKIDALINFTDEIVDQRSPLDAAGVALAGWSAVSTATHFSTFAYPALVEFRESAIHALAARAFQCYFAVGDNQCARMLDEYAHQMIWATTEQESEFRARSEAAFRYAENISDIIRRPFSYTDFTFWITWEQEKLAFPSIPSFRVHTDIQARSGQMPPRTGVYMPADDPFGALQFAWTGGHGELGDARTLNSFGRHVLDRVGREGLWSNAALLHQIINERKHKNLVSEMERSSVSLGPSAVARHSFEARPCGWYFVEMLDDEHEQIDGTYAGTSSVPTSTRPHRVEAGQQVPQNGWWYTPAQMGSRRYFKKGDRFPELKGSDYGNVLWIWSPDQSDPKL
ncbi:hypothetical protein ACLB90_10785 [Stenotrophomonas sp. LGBM10]|uniref:hypothetical protein n=1 Tax=Stenotrophomonas sp. LGBM10 TaxID=3390038 RepID=UPI00398B8EC8